MAATEFAYILLLCRANREYRNPDTLTAVTERPAGLFHFEGNGKIDYDSTVRNAVVRAKSFRHLPIEAFHADLLFSYIG
jgi:hypothetical protein